MITHTTKQLLFRIALVVAPTLTTTPLVAAIGSARRINGTAYDDFVRGAARQRVSKIEDFHQNGSENTPTDTATEALHPGRRGMDWHAAANDLEDAADGVAVFANSLLQFWTQEVCEHVCSSQNVLKTT